jgi:AcrR family transcriptional regulator
METLKLKNVFIVTWIIMFTEQQNKWLRIAEELFMRLGIKSVTMDDVARELGISKKTLYTFVENKDDLVRKVVESYCIQKKKDHSGRFSSAENAVEEMLMVITSTARQMEQMRANLLHDLQKYHRDVWVTLNEFRRGLLYEVVRTNLERGIREGLYRDNFNVDIVTRLHIATSFQLLNEDLFPLNDYSKDVLFREYMFHYLHGIMSEKGRQYLLKNAPEL